ncbi:MAG: sigma-54-dependent Fis family transcriptional regulator [bacterium]|nr:sigma-54-dependent Fis family transcriptional regulator [bacterium]
MGSALGGLDRVKRMDEEETPRTPRALIVDDAEGMRAYMATLFETRGFDVDTCDDGGRALSLLENGAAPDLILLDIMMPGTDGLAALARIRSSWPEVPVLMVSVVGKASTIVQAMQLGATDYLTKPFEEAELDAALDRLGLHSSGLAGSSSRGRGVTDPSQTVWVSSAMREIRSVIEQIGDTDVTVLIQGESGAGKEIVAREVHAVSNRVKGPFVKVNCAALPTDLLESELFGYEKGAFTGANGRKQGKFELANGGTIFLDEIGEMCPLLQAKLLQVLQDSEFTRLGGHREVHVDVRVVCATNRGLLDMVAAGDFREDLYFRLNVVAIDIPPLRERREELPLLVETFLARYAVLYERPHTGLSQRLIEAMNAHDFPGNIRELENMIKRVVVLENEDSVLAELSRPRTNRSERRAELDAMLDEIEENAGELPLREVGRLFAQEVEREAIEHMLNLTGWNRKQAASRLGISYKTLLQKIRTCAVEVGG